MIGVSQLSISVIVLGTWPPTLAVNSKPSFQSLVMREIVLSMETDSLFRSHFAQQCVDDICGLFGRSYDGAVGRCDLTMSPSESPSSLTDVTKTKETSTSFLKKLYKAIRSSRTNGREMLRLILTWFHGDIANQDLGLHFVHGAAPLICRLFHKNYNTTTGHCQSVLGDDEEVGNPHNEPSPLSNSVLAPSLRAFVDGKLTGSSRFQRLYDPLGLAYMQFFPEADIKSEIWRWAYDEESEILEPDLCLEAEIEP